MKYFRLLLWSLLILLAACDDDHKSYNPVDQPAKPILDSYETIAGNMKLSVGYHYDASKRLSLITWERSTPNITSGSDEFRYDEKGRVVEKITTITGLVRETTKYEWDGDKIFAALTYRNGKKEAFQFFDYKPNGNLESMENYVARDGGYLRADSVGCSYHADGNLHRVSRYGFDIEEQRLVYLSAVNFNEYIDGFSPVQMVDILPGVSLHKNLPSKYLDEPSSGQIVYSIEYKLRDNGYPTERIVKSSFGEERTTFTYVAD